MGATSYIRVWLVLIINAHPVNPNIWVSGLKDEGSFDTEHLSEFVLTDIKIDHFPAYLVCLYSLQWGNSLFHDHSLLLQLVPQLWQLLHKQRTTQQVSSNAIIHNYTKAMIVAVQQLKSIRVHLVSVFALYLGHTFEF